MPPPTVTLTRSAARKGVVGAGLIALAVAGALVVPTGTTATAADWRPQGIPAAAVSSGEPVNISGRDHGPGRQRHRGLAEPGENGGRAGRTRPVGQGSWSPSTRLSTLDGNASDPKVAVDSGRPGHRGLGRGGPRRRPGLHPRPHPTGSLVGGHGASSPTDQNASDPQVAVNAQRTVTIAWTADNSHRDSGSRGRQRRAAQQWGDLGVRNVSLPDDDVTGRFPHLAGRRQHLHRGLDRGRRRPHERRSPGSRTASPEWTEEVTHSTAGTDATAEDVCARRRRLGHGGLWRQLDDGDQRIVRPHPEVRRPRVRRRRAAVGGRPGRVERLGLLATNANAGRALSSPPGAASTASTTASRPDG